MTCQSYFFHFADGFVTLPTALISAALFLTPLGRLLLFAWIISPHLLLVSLTRPIDFLAPDHFS